MTVEIPLTRGQVAIVDDVDGDLAQFKWRAYFDPKRAGEHKFSAARQLTKINGKRPTEYMHRVILSRMLGRPLLQSEKVDHKHSNSLDNRRSELRLATHSQNMMNIPKRSDSTTGYKGVSWDNRSNKWQARITANNQSRSLGYFNTPKEAHEAYKTAAAELHGEFARFE